MEEENVFNRFPAVVVNASSILSLSVIRSLGRKGIPVIAVFGGNNSVDYSRQIVRHSRFISKPHYFDEVDYEKNLITILDEIGATLKRKAVLFPVTDRDMICISEHRLSLENYYFLSMPEHKLIETLLNKERLYRLLSQIGLPIAKTIFPSGINQLQDIADEITYPCLIKPSWRTPAWISAFGDQKVFVVSDPKQLTRTYRKISEHYDRLLIQEIIEGGEEDIVCGFTYLDRNCEPLGIFVCRKIRQYPPYYGDTAMAESVHESEVVELTKFVCKRLKLTGYVGLEFKKDVRGNVYKIIEITQSRINRQAGLSDALGVNIPYLWYSHLVGRPERQFAYKGGRKWVSEVNEARALVGYIRKRYGILQWLRSLRHIKRYELAALDDPMPVVLLLPSILLFILRRLLASWKEVFYRFFILIL